MEPLSSIRNSMIEKSIQEAKAKVEKKKAKEDPSYQKLFEGNITLGDI